MLEEQARVLAVEEGAVWVEADRRRGCARCEAGQGCGGGVLGRLTTRGSSRVRALNALQDLAEGDEVVLGLDEQLLVRGSIMTYLVPLITMLLAAIFAEQFLQTSDLAVAAFGAVGLGAGLLILRMYSRGLQHNARFQPRVLRRAGSKDSGCRVQPGN